MNLELMKKPKFSLERFEQNAANLVRPVHRLYLPTWSWNEIIVANSIFKLPLKDLGSY